MKTRSSHEFVDTTLSPNNSNNNNNDDDKATNGAQKASFGEPPQKVTSRSEETNTYSQIVLDLVQ